MRSFDDCPTSKTAVRQREIDESGKQACHGKPPRPNDDVKERATITMDICYIFSATARRRQFQSAIAARSEDRWLIRAMGSELISRLSDEPSIEGPVLLLGHHPGETLDTLGVPFTHFEDDVPINSATFGAALAIGTLDTVNDLPGTLIRIRRSLKPSGRFFGAFAGAGSGQFLRQTIRASEPTIARCHPQIDVRGAGDLLARAGFAQPVADMDHINVRYSALSQLLNDVRANGLGNAMNLRSPLARSTLAHWAERFEQAKDDDGKVTETLCPVYLSGVAPPSK